MVGACSRPWPRPSPPRARTAPFGEVVVRAVEDDPEFKRWELVEALTYCSTNSATVRPRFRTDFASVPRVVTWLIPRYGRYTKAAIVHDYLCDVEVPRGAISRGRRGPPPCASWTSPPAPLADVGRGPVRRRPRGPADPRRPRRRALLGVARPRRARPGARGGARSADPRRPRALLRRRVDVLAGLTLGAAAGRPTAEADQPPEIPMTGRDLLEEDESAAVPDGRRPDRRRRRCVTLYERPDRSRYALDARGRGYELSFGEGAIGPARFDAPALADGRWAGSRSGRAAAPRDLIAGGSRSIRSPGARHGPLRYGCPVGRSRQPTQEEDT